MAQPQLPRFKISVAELIDVVTEEREQALARYEAELKDYPRKRDDWLQKTLGQLEEAIDRVRAGEPVNPDSDYRAWELNLASPPQEPPGTVELATCKHDQTLDYLHRVTTPTVSLRPDEYQRLTGRTYCGTGR